MKRVSLILLCSLLYPAPAPAMDFSRICRNLISRASFWKQGIPATQATVEPVADEDDEIGYGDVYASFQRARREAKRKGLTPERTARYERATGINIDFRPTMGMLEFLEAKGLDPQQLICLGHGQDGAIFHHPQIPTSVFKVAREGLNENFRYRFGVRAEDLFGTEPDRQKWFIDLTAIDSILRQSIAREMAFRVADLIEMAAVAAEMRIPYVDFARIFTVGNNFAEREYRKDGIVKFNGEILVKAGEVLNANEFGPMSLNALKSQDHPALRAAMPLVRLPPGPWDNAKAGAIAYEIARETGSQSYYMNGRMDELIEYMVEKNPQAFVSASLYQETKDSGRPRLIVFYDVDVDF